MQELKKSLIAFFGLVSLIGVLAALTPHAGYSQGGPHDKDVNVVNTPNVRVINSIGDPVPTVAQGTTDIAGTVQARQSGDWNVGVFGTPNVRVVSGESAVHVLSGTDSPVFTRDVDNAARQPFQRSLVIDIPAGQVFAVGTFVVPAGKRLVIEYASGIGQPFSPAAFGQKLQFFAIGTLVNSEFARHLLVPSERERSLFVAAQQMRVYADPGTEVTIVAQRDNNIDQFRINFSVSGYLVDLP